MKVFELIEKLNKLTDAQKLMDVCSEDYENGLYTIEIVEEVPDYSSSRKVQIIVLK